ncbi:Asp23/Gls24 family envelope stress response protein [Terribacillus saccharophilus]|jgi:uncharacterized alkaline shock family protein YloU|uniref:Asp23/Gls24 family envelope stress response protein n=1 Tax=Terribacillus saccharophilus TaxID=361277 RepID=A0A268HCZ8_9BACI|nr:MULTISPECIES: Asp23/Gls24 family envelope stress response protein [Terribacillus]PAE07753.1 Asp23/Gls24 family envelope stress response protein [Terribacillus saccharophilus]
MSLHLTSEDGKITISTDVIATLAGSAAEKCYGIVGMASRHQLRDGIAEILRRENYSKGIVVTQADNKVQIDLHIIVSYGTKISEVAHNVQSQVKYTLDRALGVLTSSVNIYIQGVSVSAD